MKLSDYLGKILDNVESLYNRHTIKFESEPLIAFRGESQDYGKTKLMPSIFRDSSYISKEKHLFELMCDYELISHDKRNIDKAIETQHYIAISRMLDITFNATVALYFACLDETSDGYVYTFSFPEYYSPHSNYVEDFYNNILEYGESKTYFKNFKVISHSYSNDRIKAQSGGFIFFPGESFSPLNEVYYEYVKIDKNDKKKLLKELNMVFHINNAKLFPEKNQLAEIIKEKFKNDHYSNEDVTLENEVDSCFKRIEYEINSNRRNSIEDTLRYLRKEKEDLLTFIKIQKRNDNCNKDRNYEEMMKKVNKKFEIISLLHNGKGNNNV